MKKKSGISIITIPFWGLVRRIICEVAGFLLMLIPSFITRYLMDEMVEQGRGIPYYWYAVTIGGAFLIHIFLFYFQNYRSQIFMNDLASEFGRIIVKKITTSRMPEYEAQSKSKILNMLTMDVGSVYTHCNYALCIPVDTIKILTVLVLIFRAHFGFALVAVLLAPVYVLSSYTNKSKLAQLVDEERKAGDEMVQEAEVLINGKVSIGLNRASSYLLDRFNRKRDIFYKARNRQHFYLLITKELPSLITTMAPVLILIVGGNAVTQGQITLGTLVFAMQLIGYLFAPLAEIATLRAELMSMKPVFQRGKDFVALPDQKDTMEGVPGDAVCLKNATLLRPDNTPLYNIEEFTVEGPGLILIKGENGCGKSTLFNFLAGVFAEEQLEVGEGGCCRISSRYRNNMGYLYYPNFIFPGTVKENVLYGREIADQEYEKVNEILNLPPADKEVKVRPENLSLGEKQKIFLARLLAGGYDCILLDEPGSNLDDRTEEDLICAIGKLKQTKLIMVISHNERYDGIADQVYIIRNKKMVKSGGQV